MPEARIQQHHALLRGLPCVIPSLSAESIVSSVAAGAEGAGAGAGVGAGGMGTGSAASRLTTLHAVSPGPACSAEIGVAADPVDSSANCDDVDADPDAAGMSPSSSFTRMLQQSVAASCGGVVTALTVQPFDVIKTRLQSQPSLATPAVGQPRLQLACSACRIAPRVTPMQRASPQLSGTWDALRKISQKEGVVTLWRGLSPTLVMTVPSSGIYFTCYDQLRVYLSRHDSPVASFAPMIAGVTSRSIAAAVTSPLELLRTYMASPYAKRSGSAIEHARHVVQRHSLPGLWRGLGPTLLRDVPFSGIYWSAYESIKRRLLQTRQDGFVVHFTSGATAGSLAAALTIPVDVVKTRMQVDLLSPQRMGMREVIRAVHHEHGLVGFTHGLTARVAKVSPACAIMISSYELCKRYVFSDLQ